MSNVQSGTHQGGSAPIWVLPVALAFAWMVGKKVDAVVLPTLGYWWAFLAGGLAAAVTGLVVVGVVWFFRRWR